MMDFWDADGDFDYEAHHEAGQRTKAAQTAERIGYHGMTDAFHYFGLHDWTSPMFTPELLAAMDTWQDLTERIEAAPADQDIKDLQRRAEEAARRIQTLTDKDA